MMVLETPACREYTHPRGDSDSRIYAAIPGRTIIGFVLQVHIVQCLGPHRSEIQISSVHRTPNPHAMSRSRTRDFSRAVFHSVSCQRLSHAQHVHVAQGPHGSSHNGALCHHKNICLHTMSAAWHTVHLH